MTRTTTELKEEVRRKYAEAAKGDGCGCREDGSCCDEEAFGQSLYPADELPIANPY